MRNFAGGVLRQALLYSARLTLLVGLVGCMQTPGLYQTASTSAVAIPMATPSIREFIIGSKNLGNPFDVRFDRQGNLWFNAVGYNYLGRLSKHHTIHAYRLKKQRNNYGVDYADWLALGPDGNLWFTDYYGETLGTIIGTHIYQYGPPKGYYAWTAGLVPYGRNIWVVTLGFLYGELDEFSTKAKLLKRIRLTGYYCYPDLITVDTSGTFWIGNSANCPKITRVTQSGTVTDFPISAADGVWAITLGPDGNVWFTAADGPTANTYVGKITPDGVITTYPIPGQADGIALGPDGNWWITLPFVGQILNMDLQGNILGTYTIPDAKKGSSTFQLAKIVLGPDGNMWFGEGNRRRIGELILAPK